MVREIIFAAAAIAAVGIMLVGAQQYAIADPHPEDHTKSGNNGQCWKLQKELDLGGTKQDCHDSFTGKDHNDDDGGSGSN
jgi:hypothetical protein